MTSAAPDLAHWADRAREMADRHPQIHAYEVRGGMQRDRTFIRRGGEIRTSGSTYVAGVGIRAYHGAGSGYAYTNELSDASIGALVEQVARLAVSNAPHNLGPPRAPGPARRITYAPGVRDAPDQADESLLHELLVRAEAGAEAAVPGIRSQVAFGYKRERNILLDSDGGAIDTGFLQTTLLAQAVARDGAKAADGNAWLGGERGLGDYETDGGPEALGRRAAEEAQEALRAKPIPTARYRCLTDNHLSGLMAHESFGHLTESDLVASGWSVLQGRLGETLASPRVTIRDVPVFADGRRGVVVPYDDEGSAGRPVTMLDRGRLTSLMHGRDSAEHDGLDPTGNARALNVTHAPIVRMRNTYIEPGDLSLDEALEALGDGIYLIGGRGGSPRADGSFMFTAQRGYKVENGELVHPVRMASIQGNVLDFLQNVEGLTRDLEVYTTYFGGCGKWDQSYLHVGTGGPHVLVSEALIGGQGP